MLRKIYFALLLGVIVCSCVPHRKTVLLQSAQEGRDSILARQEFIYKVQPKDILHISVTSYNSELTDFFNVKREDAGGGYYMTGYMIDLNGYIHVPVLDSVYVEGLSVQEVQEVIKNQISEYVVGANVMVKLVNFKITVLGEVGSQGIKIMEGDEFTIYQALALSGGIGELGDRENIRLVRKVGAESKIVTLDLTRRDIIASEYYYLQPNDIIYVEPLRAKSARANYRVVRDALGVLSIIWMAMRIRSIF